jgi:hypothetical protein
MAITTFDPGWVGAAKQRTQYKKTATRTTVAVGWFSMFDIAGNPGAGTLAIGNTANGLVHTDAIAGYPTINAFGGSNTGYLGRCVFGNTVACRIRLYDRLFSCGAYAYNAATTLASQPSFLGRVPGGTAALTAGCTEIWAEQVTAATGNQAVAVGYTNEAGTASRATGAVGIGAAPTVGRMWQLPLQAGDRGISVLNSVTGTVATVGTFNVHVMRLLGEGRVQIANFADVQDMIRTGTPQVFADSAVIAIVCADSTSSGLPDVDFDVVNG